MKSLLVKLGLILIGLAIFANAEAWGSECAWVLWKRTMINYDQTSKRWETVGALPTYGQYMEVKSNLIINEIEAYRKISKSVDVTSADHIVAIIRDAKNQRDVINTLDYYCFPDTIDPRKEERR